MSPLGPFNGKSFGTTMSPWIITLEALRPFEAVPANPHQRAATYLQDAKRSSTYAIQLQADIVTPNHTETICKSRTEWLYWTFRDMVAQQTINGCPLRSGDLLATGTVSGPEEGSQGCLMEITNGGRKEWSLSDGSSRTYLQDGDGVRLTGWAGELGSPTCVGFGEAYGVVMPNRR